VAGEMLRTGEGFDDLVSGLDSSNEQIQISSLSSVINMGAQGFNFSIKNLSQPCAYLQPIFIIFSTF
jgi:hypothetical protein